jgi:hypothetical protein
VTVWGGRCLHVSSWLILASDDVSEGSDSAGKRPRKREKAASKGNESSKEKKARVDADDGADQPGPDTGRKRSTRQAQPKGDGDDAPKKARGKKVRSGHVWLTP